jgi:hypothetical protein
MLGLPQLLLSTQLFAQVSLHAELRLSEGAGKHAQLLLLLLV